MAAASLQIKRINDFVNELLEIVNITDSYIYGIDSNGYSVKIAIDTIKEYMTGDIDADLTILWNKCINNSHLISQLQSALESKQIINIKGYHILLPNETAADYLGTLIDAEIGDLYFVGDGVNDNEEYVKSNNGWQMLGGISRAETEAKIKELRDSVQDFVDDITVVDNGNSADFTLIIPDSVI